MTLIAGLDDGLAVMHCKDIACEEYGISRVVDHCADEALDLAIGADGLPLVAFYDSCDNDLKLIRCADKACAIN